MDGQVAIEVYERLLRSRWPDYMVINGSRSVERCLDWWRELTQDWLIQIGQDPGMTERLMSISDRLLYDPNGGYFSPFDDAVRALEAVRNIGLPMIVVSNWDYSLHRMLGAHRLSPYFSHVFASLEEGVEKPDPKLFEIAVGALGLSASDVIHVGDHPADDYSGAISAGLGALLVDRSAPRSSGYVISSLDEIVHFI